MEGGGNGVGSHNSRLTVSWSNIGRNDLAALFTIWHHAWPRHDILGPIFSEPRFYVLAASLALRHHVCPNHDILNLKYWNSTKFSNLTLNPFPSHKSKGGGRVDNHCKLKTSGTKSHIFSTKGPVFEWEKRSINAGWNPPPALAASQKKWSRLVKRADLDRPIIKWAILTQIGPNRHDRGTSPRAHFHNKQINK